MPSISQEMRRRLRQQHCEVGYAPADAAILVDLACSAYERAHEVALATASLDPKPRIMAGAYHLASQLLGESFTHLAAAMTAKAAEMGCTTQPGEVEIAL